MLPSALLVLALTSVVSAIWPVPQNMTTGSSVLFMQKGIKISYNGQSVRWTPGTCPIPSYAYRTNHERLLNHQVSYTAGYVPHGPDFDSRGVVQAAVSRVFDRIFTSTFVPWKFVPRDQQTTFEPSLGRGGHSKNSTGGITYMKSLTITQSGTDAPGFFKALSGDVDESYSLNVDASGAATLNAVSAIGIVRGLETFAQLFYAHSSGTFWYTNLAPLSITDKPTYSHRGLLMDVARNFFSVSDIKRTIDGLSWNKMNRLHLHATDSQSWPLVLPTLPEVSEKGAYRPDFVYTPEMLKDIQEYAVLRGVQVIVEIDMPSHIGVLGESHPELVVAYNKEPWYWYCAEPPCGAIKLNDSAVEDFLGKMFDDVLPRVLPYSSYFHIGGDEMNLNDTLIDPNVASDDPAVIKPLMATLIGNQFQRIRDAGLTPMVWEEMALHWELDLGEDAVVQAWLGPDSVKNITAKGYKVVDSNYQFNYLDCGRGQWLNFDNGEAFTTFYPFDNWCSPQKNWRLIYSHDPADGVEDENQKKLVLGGEVAAWSENIDGTDLDVTIWPRAAAAAEVYWSGRIDPATGQNRTQLNAAPRLAEMRERMVNAGIGGANVYMSWCTQHDPKACSYDYSYLHG